jgi:hypothetical protein
MRPKAFELIARAVEAGIQVTIVDTVRTEAEQAANIAKGVSWTTTSRHLPRNLRGASFFQPDDAAKADAIDICPFEQFNLHGPDKLQWDDKDPAWQVLGKIGERIGLKWGVMKNGKRIDLGHFELFPDEIF